MTSSRKRHLKESAVFPSVRENDWDEVIKLESMPKGSGCDALVDRERIWKPGMGFVQLPG